MNFFSRRQSDASSMPLSAPEESKPPVFDEENLILALEALGQNKFDFPVKLQGRVGPAIQSLTRKLQDATTKDTSRTINYSTQAGEALYLVALIAEDIKYVGTDAQTMSASVEQMSASINQVASASEDTSSAANAAQESAQRSLDQIDPTKEAMAEISRLGEVLSSRLKVLEEAAEHIEGMAQTIEGISNQTKLLALNATIEAARAGEAGKGFAVVASEVKQLSEQTSKATVIISERISTLNSEMKEMKQAMLGSQEAVAHGEEVVDQIGVQVENIFGQVSSASTQMNEISGILSEQRHAMQEISKNISDIAGRASQSRDKVDGVTQSIAKIENVIGKRLDEIDPDSVPNFILYRAISDHVIWRKKIAEMFAGLVDPDPAALTNHHSCRLGKWYDQVTDSVLLNNPHFQKLIGPHEAVHQHGIEATKLFATGNIIEAKKSLTLMDNASQEVIRLLNQLINDLQ